MKRGWLWVALLLSLGVNIGVLATIGVARLRVKERWERAHDHRPPPFERLAEHLRLEGEQRQRFIDIHRALFETTQRQRQELEEVRSRLRLEVMGRSPDAARVDQLLAEAAAVNQTLDRAMIESVLATREILDAEQQRRYFRVMERVRQAGRPFEHPSRGPRSRRPPPVP